MTSVEISLTIAVVALIAWNLALLSLLRYHQQHLAEHGKRMDAHQQHLAEYGKRMDAHQQHLAAHDEALRLHSITPIPAAVINRFEDRIAAFDAKVRELERSDGD